MSSFTEWLHKRFGSTPTIRPPRAPWIDGGTVPRSGLYDGQTQASHELRAELEASAASLSAELAEVRHPAKLLIPEVHVRDGYVYGGVPVEAVDARWLARHRARGGYESE